MSRTQLRKALILCLSGGAALSLAACSDVSPAPPVETQDLSIVGGTPTTSWPAVGTLVVDDGGANFASFCTATLIAPNWVLTAAHCVSDPDIPQWAIKFTTCPDARSRAACTSTIYPSVRLYPHPSYNAADNTHDIALVQLASSPDVTPMPLRTSPVNVGQALTWVGYGNTDGWAGTGGGLKRQGDGLVNGAYSLIYTYGMTAGVMTCQGDSGGPALMQNGGSWEIGGTVTAGSEGCEDSGLDTLVNIHVGWINDTMNGDVWQPCDLLGGSCDAGQLCAPLDPNNCIPAGGEATGTACNADNSTWGSAFPCRDGAICLGISETDDTAGQCYDYCHVDGDCPSGQECTDNIFDPTTGLDFGVCVPEATPCDFAVGNCPAGMACFPTQDGSFQCFESDGLAIGAVCDSNSAEWTSLPCVDAAMCVQVSDNVSDGRCFQACTSDAGCDPLDECFDIFTDLENVGVCVCRDADGDGTCAVDDCNDNDASVAADCGGTCVDNDGDTYGNGCAAGPDCNDGDASIHAGCGAGSCTDNDGDTFGVGCAAGPDCDDSNPGVHDGCGSEPGCVDMDGDGYGEGCTRGPDCNDASTTSHPGAAEFCGDGADNDCDGAIDEDCASCIDADGDGYCVESDCVDSNSAINPGAGELCGDSLDNDCDGIIDEDCAGCTDADGDGYCEGVDCNDQAAAIRPGAPELCDRLDNNCNGAVDEGCPSDRQPVDTGSDDTANTGGASGCSVASSTPVSAWAGLLLFGALLRRRRR